MFIDYVKQVITDLNESYTFPAFLTSKQRQIIHNLAEETGLEHISVNICDSTRQITIKIIEKAHNELDDFRIIDSDNQAIEATVTHNPETATDTINQYRSKLRSKSKLRKTNKYK